MSVTQVVIADGHEIVRDGIAAGLNQIDGMSVVARVGDGYSAIKACHQSNCDILLMDLSLTRPAGSDVLTRIRRLSSDTRVVVMSSKTTFSDAIFAFSQGAIGFVPKQSSSPDIVNAITAARSGFSYLPAEFIGSMVDAQRRLSRSGNVFGLSPREIEILEASVNGQTTKQVAQLLSISIRTVETHRNNIYRKTDCNTTDALTRIAASLNLAVEPRLEAIG